MKNQVIHIRLPSNVAALLDEVAKERKVSRNRLVADAVSEKLAIALGRLERISRPYGNFVWQRKSIKFRLLCSYRAEVPELPRSIPDFRVLPDARFTYTPKLRREIRLAFQRRLTSSLLFGMKWTSSP